MRKFELLKQFHCLHSGWTESIDDCLRNAHTAINQHWQGLVNSNEDAVNTKVVKNIQPYEDLDMELPALDTFLSETKARQYDCSRSTFRPSSKFPSFPAASLPETLEGPKEYKYFRLAALEDWVGHQLQRWISLHLNEPTACGELRRLIKHYFVEASAAYASSPISLSTMYLTVAELWIACDKSACAQYGLLWEYDHELCIKEFQCLVLPLKQHMVRLHEVERYIQSRRRAAMSHLPSVYRLFGHRSSFAVRYFEQSSELQTTLAEIELRAEEKRVQKCQELEDLKTKYASLMDEYNKKRCDEETYIYNHYHNYSATRHPYWCTRCSCKNKADALSIGIYEWPVSSNTSVAKATVFELKIPQAFSDWRDTSAYMISDVLGHRDHNAERPSNSYTLNVHEDLSQMLSLRYHERRIVPLSEVKPYNVTHRKNKKAVQHLMEEDVCLRNALQYGYFDTSLGVLTKADPECTERVPKLCMYHVPQRSKALDRFMYRPPSAPDGTPPNEVIVSLLLTHSFSHPSFRITSTSTYIRTTKTLTTSLFISKASLSDCPAHFPLEEYKAFGTLPFGSEIIYSNILTQLATSAMDFKKAETQCLIFQTTQQVGAPSQDVERTSHAVLADEHFGHALLKQLEISLQRVSENWESWRASSGFSLLARRTLSLTQSSKVRARALEYVAELRSVCFKWLRRLKARAAASTDDEQRSELYSRLTEIALLCTSTYDVENVDFEIILRQNSAVSIFFQSSIIIQENHHSVQSEHQALYESLLQCHRAMMYRAFESLTTVVLEDSTGLCDAITANWASFDPSTTDGWCLLEQPQHHWLAIQSNTRLVHFNLLTAELLVDGLPLTRLPSEFIQHELYRPLFAKSTLEVAPTSEPGLRFSARYVYHNYKLHFGMWESDMLVVAVQGNYR